MADYVTGLALRGELHAAIERLAETATPCAVVICDVVGLKVVNEREGFLAGDAVLRRAADRLRAAAAGATLLARLGGDEMVAVFIGPEADAAAATAARVLAGAEAPPLRSAAVSAGPAAAPGPLIERLYATMRQS